ncbi:hypothetical protein QBC39DRAFT_258822 [Podospora conica]|nr:hypothetical protein QBC39DRAFT_258822 [Schizothecium conicum]
MDPCTILGAAGALANVIDVLGKTLRGINDLRCQWRDADLSILTLESQLSALGSALVKIKQWTESSEGEIHHQLVMDLDSSVACCHVLVSKIDAEVSQFRFSNNILQASSRFRLLLKTKDFEKIQVMLERQTGALGLLLIACNTTALTEQKALLEQRPVRKALLKIQSDSASLIVHRDGDSRITSRTVASMVSRLSEMFDFDTELFSTAIYRTWMKGVVKERHGHSHSHSRAKSEAPKRPSHGGQRPHHKSPTRYEHLRLSSYIDI